jgi:hypothetical protein
MSFNEALPNKASNPHSHFGGKRFNRLRQEENLPVFNGSA